MKQPAHAVLRNPLYVKKILLCDSLCMTYRLHKKQRSFFITLDVKR